MSRIERYRDQGRSYHPLTYSLAQIHSEINRAFERFFDNPIWEKPMSIMPAINMKDDGNQYTIEADMPGLEDRNIEIEIHGNQLIIKGEHEQQEEKQGEKMYISERKYGSFHRSITIPEDANHDNIQASYENGVLVIAIPKDPGKKPRKITINRNRPAE
ncbi:Hsp20/alpha crystallin family protein [Thermoactinomyces mirandus]|uniref:Hsp20/alpha crystallin family protein n=1 Tax=Thermoactinomyces mirandus TaxID=2756294 RepID=A0A7W1XPW4_9BACL|nr:Hsp20/alpha crystallin family protein [Thermoactinomyces mirandus]MBA4601104.1 Hsp20/alpha crystallin family protein [Thermoactinomyces mirandus]